MADEPTFEWDDAKAASNLETHGVSFGTAVEACIATDGVHIEDRRRAYGEGRSNLSALVGGFPLIVTYTQRAGAVHIISARKANRKER